jgi:hypothetical protein
MDGGRKRVPVSLQDHHLQYSLQVILTAVWMLPSFSNRMCMIPSTQGLHGGGERVERWGNHSSVQSI